MNVISSSKYRGENRLAISILKEQIENDWSDFTSKYYYRGKFWGELEIV